MTENIEDINIDDLSVETVAATEVAPELLHMIPYNTGMKPVKLAEYGRNVQNLVDFCVSIPIRRNGHDAHMLSLKS